MISCIKIYLSAIKILSYLKCHIIVTLHFTVQYLKQRQDKILYSCYKRDCRIFKFYIQLLISFYGEKLSCYQLQQTLILEQLLTNISTKYLDTPKGVMGTEFFPDCMMNFWKTFRIFPTLEL